MQAAELPPSCDGIENLCIRPTRSEARTELWGPCAATQAFWGVEARVPIKPSLAYETKKCRRSNTPRTAMAAPLRFAGDRTRFGCAIPTKARLAKIRPPGGLFTALGAGGYTSERAARIDRSITINSSRTTRATRCSRWGGTGGACLPRCLSPFCFPAAVLCPFFRCSSSLVSSSVNANQFTPSA